MEIYLRVRCTGWNSRCEEQLEYWGTVTAEIINAETGYEESEPFLRFSSPPFDTGWVTTPGFSDPAYFCPKCSEKRVRAGVRP